MKTLIFNGSPRKNGDTAAIINRIKENLQGDCKIVDAYYSEISPCMDCRWCRKNEGCCITDDMQEVYAYIQECDNIIIASPIYFSELTGKILDLGSRLQTYYTARYSRNENPIIKKKKGAVILVGGGDGNVDKAYSTARILLRHMNVTDIFPVVYSHNTDKKSAIEDENLIEGVNGILEFFEK